jgi:hypothetical protein
MINELEQEHDKVQDIDADGGDSNPRFYRAPLNLTTLPMKMDIEKDR